MKRYMVRRPGPLAAVLGLVGVVGIMAAGLPVVEGPGTVERPATRSAAAVESTGVAVSSSGVGVDAVVGIDTEVGVVGAEGSSGVGAVGGESGGERVVATETGSASYYASSLAGRLTASGVPYDPGAAVAAHRTLPFGTRLRVHNLSNGRSVEVEVVDRGPFAKGRVLDLSRSAAERLDFIREGHVRVRIEVLE